MIYIVIGKDNSNGDEWVRAETFYTAPEATQLCERLNKTRDDATYRVDTVEPTERQRTKDFAIDELFPGVKSWNEINKHGARTCQECGAIIEDTRKHVAWHNKLLP